MGLPPVGSIEPACVRAAVPDVQSGTSPPTIQELGLILLPPLPTQLHSPPHVYTCEGSQAGPPYCHNYPGWPLWVAPRARGDFQSKGRILGSRANPGRVRGTGWARSCIDTRPERLQPLERRRRASRTRPSGVPQSGTSRAEIRAPRLVSSLARPWPEPAPADGVPVLPRAWDHRARCWTLDFCLFFVPFECQ